MAVTVRSDWSAQLLINYVTTEVQTLEPDLFFASVGLRKDVPKGYNVLAFPQTSQIATTSVTSVTEGQVPTAVTWGSTAYTGTQTQKGIVIQVSDLLVRSSAVEVIVSGTRQVRYALARAIDVLLQSTVEAGSNVIYAGGKSARASLGSGDLIDATLLVKAIKTLRAASLMPAMGKYYWGVIHPNQETDLMLNTSTGAWIDIGRYTSPLELKEGKMGEFRGARVLSSANVQTFSSTVTVYPMLIGGYESFGWGYFQQPEPILVTTPDSSNPLNTYNSIGAKATLGVTRFEETRLARIESAVSA